MDSDSPSSPPRCTWQPRMLPQSQQLPGRLTRRRSRTGAARTFAVPDRAGESHHHSGAENPAHPAHHAPEPRFADAETRRDGNSVPAVHQPAAKRHCSALRRRIKKQRALPAARLASGSVHSPLWSRFSMSRNRVVSNRVNRAPLGYPRKFPYCGCPPERVGDHGVARGQIDGSVADHRSENIRHSGGDKTVAGTHALPSLRTGSRAPRNARAHLLSILEVRGGLDGIRQAIRHAKLETKQPLRRVYGLKRPECV